ncbi:flagellin [Siminovitchia sp. 179-K 8D1 HS]|uniref:flagellin N-terminal helical domain-containing protein n=1 Tax=Siminovitchia sp. 179-K 8D1 HS TaxID=3142385 RepID=UPI00399F31B4
MRINHNIMALNTHRQLTQGTNIAGKNMERLSSGLRINRAADDAAGLSISEKMRGQIRGLDMATKNAQDGISLIQTAEGALNETHAILQRMRELVVQAGNGTNEPEDLNAIQTEINALVEELGGTFKPGDPDANPDPVPPSGSKGISDRTEFNGKALLDGSLNIKFQIGANATQQVTLTIGNMSANGLGVDTIDVKAFETPATDFDTQLGWIDSAINTVSDERSKLGALQNRLEHTINNLSNASENLTAAESRIRDVDYTEAA